MQKALDKESHNHDENHYEKGVVDFIVKREHLLHVILHLHWHVIGLNLDEDSELETCFEDLHHIDPVDEVVEHVDDDADELKYYFTSIVLDDVLQVSPWQAQNIGREDQAKYHVDIVGCSVLLSSLYVEKYYDG